ncbi:MAG: acetyl-CoA carboxylase biotin carboxyl carrier protein subunit [bacterium]|nr:acetyl-CoA carboxylase biotin carboxyl carrier protein subunit [bacterium]
MDLDICLNNNKTSKVILEKQKNNLFTFTVDDKKYEVDAVRVSKGIYSILLNGKSYNIELIEGKSNKFYNVNTYRHTYEAEIIDAESRYVKSRQSNSFEDSQNQITSPMPGKIVEIPVKVGDKVEVNDTVIIVSAMKMESEYKAGKEGIIKEILVKAGDTIDSNQVLLTID